MRLLLLLPAILFFLSSFSAHAETAALLVKNGLIFTEKPGETAPAIGYFTAGKDGKILQVAAGTVPAGVQADHVIDAKGKFVIPGFVSGHTHIYQSVIRGVGIDQTLRGWGKAMDRVSGACTPEDRYLFNLVGCYDLLAHGITTSYAFNDAGGHPGWNEKGFEGCLASGLRFLHGYCLPFKGDHASRLADFETFYKFTQAYQGKPTFLGVSLGGYSCFTKDRSYAMDEGEIMKKYNLWNEAHYLEPPEPDIVQAQQSMFSWYIDSGELGSHLCFGHFIHVNDDILKKVAAAGASMVWNPLSNGRLASGTPDIPRYRSMGIRIGMGVDGQASADIADPFENMRAGLYVIRAKYMNAAILMPADVLRFHTLGSADVLGIADRVGSLEPGKYADFLIVDPRTPETGPIYDPYGTLVLACGSSNIEQAYVGGKLIADHGVCVQPGVKEAWNNAYAAVDRIMKAPAPPSDF
jgi:cytosine/adenosine deaminase-related metal-dependent hydrolase